VQAQPRTYRLRRGGYHAWRLAIPRPEHPEWRFEAHGLQRALVDSVRREIYRLET
jgi:hypothetical protein